MLKKNYKLLLSAIAILSLTAFPLVENTAYGQSDSSEEPETSYPAFDVGGFLQQQFIADQTPDSPPRFSTHRARMGVTGKITELISITLIGGYTEPPNNTPRLVNAFVDFDIHPLLQVRTGQFLVPFGLEGPQPIPLNPAIERSTTIRGLNTFAMFRDVGVQISGSRSMISYAVAVVNGAGANQTEQIDPKDLIGRVGVTLTDEIEVGLSGHVGQYQPNPATDTHESRYRAGLDVSYIGHPLFLRGEYQIREDDRPATGGQTMNGGYLLGGYELTDKLETIARYEYFDRNTSLDDNHFTGFTIGASYYFVSNTRLSANYEFRDDQLNPDLGNLFTIQMQVTL